MTHSHMSTHHHLQYIESLLLTKLRNGVITQAEYDSIMHTRIVARELMAADGVRDPDEFPFSPLR